jgi:hypothetical protein
MFYSALPQTLPAADHVAPAKKSRFKAAQEQKVKQKKHSHSDAPHDFDGKYVECCISFMLWT